MPVEKAKDFKGTLKRLMGYLISRKISIIIVILLAVFSTIFTIVAPKIMGKATTKIFEGFINIKNGIPNATIDFNYISKILLILGAIYIISSLFNFIMQYMMASIVQKIVFDMRKDISNKLEKLPLKFYDSHKHGEILSRVTNDVDNISNTLQQSAIGLITSIITISGIILMMLLISPIMTLITLITLPLCIIITKKVAKKSQKYFKSQQKLIGKLNGHIEEMYTGHKIVKSYGYEEKSISKFQKINNELYEVGWKAQFISGIIMPLMNLVNNLGYVFVCIVGSLLMIRNSLKIGDIQAFLQYSRRFSRPIIQTANIANIIQSAIASAERVFEILDEEEEKEISDDTGNIINTNKLKGAVKFNNVCFGYNKENILINEMNINVKSGQTVAIVGPTGAGKTTLVNLLMHFYDLNSGNITIDGVDISHLKRGSLRSMFGMVLQDTWLFKGTIRENIAYGRKNATEEEIIVAAKTAHADHFIRTLPNGYDTILNEEASNISGGQKQLLTIARAIIADPAILILDEATSSVDTRTEIHIQKAMDSLMKGRTSFVIAHRLSTIKDADLILVMSNGDIIEMGNHEQLLKMNGFYAELYNSQFIGNNFCIT
ncbi:MAG: ABC transporter ATP-binding protein/permease [Vallitalea sp.]|nr:ABC transporter ATP-binding protein/permease [Vallitalea sp.]